MLGGDGCVVVVARVGRQIAAYRSKSSLSSSSRPNCRCACVVGWSQRGICDGCMYVQRERVLVVVSSACDPPHKASGYRTWLRICGSKGREIWALNECMGISLCAAWCIFLNMNKEN